MGMTRRSSNQKFEKLGHVLQGTPSKTKREDSTEPQKFSDIKKNSEKEKR